MTDEWEKMKDAAKRDRFQRSTLTSLSLFLSYSPLSPYLPVHSSHSTSLSISSPNFLLFVLLHLLLFLSAGCWWRRFRMSAGTVVIAGGILATVILLTIVAVLCLCRLQVWLFYYWLFNQVSTTSLLISRLKYYRTSYRSAHVNANKAELWLNQDVSPHLYSIT